jgi:uncharacterized membrane protein
VRWKQVGNKFVAETLPLPQAGTTSTAAAVNRDGTVVVGNVTTNTAGIGIAYRWTSADSHSLGVLPEGTHSDAVSVSEDGLVVVGFGDRPGVSYRAWRWTQAEGIVPLPLAIADALTIARDTNENGTVTVGSETNATDAMYTAGGALLWDFSGVHYVRDLLLASGVPPADLSGWNLGEAIAISSDGKTVLGNGRNPSGFPESWIARLP